MVYAINKRREVIIIYCIYRYKWTMNLLAIIGAQSLIYCSKLYHTSKVLWCQSLSGRKIGHERKGSGRHHGHLVQSGNFLCCSWNIIFHQLCAAPAITSSFYQGQTYGIKYLYCLHFYDKCIFVFICMLYSSLPLSLNVCIADALPK